MRKFAALILILCLSIPALAAKKKTRRGSARKTATASAGHKPGSARRSTHNAGAARSAGKSGRSRTAVKKRKQTWRSGQMQPTPERYQEIQKALAEKGYSSDQPDGVWGPRWADALKRFQAEQKIEPTGKLNSLSLIALGLGPKRDGPGATTPGRSTTSSDTSDTKTRELP